MGGVSSALMLSFGGVLVWQAAALAGSVVQMVTWRRAKVENEAKPNLAPTEDTLAPRDDPSRLLSHFRNGNYNRPVMLLPGVREMRLHGRKREKKGW
jgi:hypothetical protein